MLPDNLVQLLLQNLNRHPMKQALFAKRQGSYVPMSYQEWFESVKWFALGLRQLSIGESDFVALLSGNRPEWVVADMGILSIGAINVPIYATLAAPEIEFILKDCGAHAIIVETQEHLDKVLDIADQCPQLQHIIMIERYLTRLLDPRCKTMDEIILLGKESTDTAYEEYLSFLNRITPQHLASIVYTSGTTGEPKGVMLTHGNFLADVNDILMVLPVTDEDVVLSFLPLSHVFERTTGYYSVIAAGGAIYYAESMDTIAANMAEVKPTVVVSVPRLYEKMQKRILGSLSGIKKTLFKWAMRVAERKKEPSVWIWFQYAVANQLVFSKIRSRTGGRLRFFVSGGAPLSKEIAQFFETLGMLIIEGYGLTETSPVIACNRLTQYKFGTVGKVLPSQEIRLADDGELQVRGPIVMAGYLNQPEKTAEAVDSDGWFSTGDIAEIDSDGFVRIVDRKKELIVLSNGKKVAPQMLEMRLKADPLVSQVVVCGENRNYLTALIVPDFDALKRVQKETAEMDNADLVNNPRVIALFQERVRQRTTGLANFEQIKKFHLLAQEMTPESGELTPSLKLRRKVIGRNYSVIIDQFYQQDSQSI
jgi:long-chain acyl-CoA synthetase